MVIFTPLNSGERMGYIRSLYKVSMNAWYQFMADPE